MSYLGFTWLGSHITEGHEASRFNNMMRNVGRIDHVIRPYHGSLLGHVTIISDSLIDVLVSTTDTRTDLTKHQE